MKQYLKVLEHIKAEGLWKPVARENMPETLGISHATIQQDLSEGFPLLTTKRMYFKGIVNEFLWFLRGETNIKFLVDNGVNIWNGDAYRWYLEQAKSRGLRPAFKTKDEFIKAIKYHNDHTKYVFQDEYKLGDLGKVYGYQWRNQNGVDQISEIINSLNNKPFSRYHILDAWNKADFSEMALPPCHLLWQFIVRPDESSFHDKNILDLSMYQRSCDMFLGVPFDLAMMGLMLIVMAKVTNMTPGQITWIGGDTHIYKDHMVPVRTIIQREPKSLPTVKLNKELNNINDIVQLEYLDFELVGYNPHASIKAHLSTGLTED